MKNSVFINCTALSEYAFKKLPSGKTSFEAVTDYAEKLPDAEKIYILCCEPDENDIRDALTASKKGGSGKWEIISRPEWDSSLLFDEFANSAKGFDNIFYIFGDTPFLEIGTANRMYEKHVTYSAQYSFSDGAPFGITPEIVSCEIAGALKVLSDTGKLKLDRDTIFTVIQRDINSFDIETELAEKDLRMLRISLAADSKRNYMMLCSFDSAGISGANRIINITQKDKKMLRTLPAYFPVQITERCFQACSYCPYPLVNKSLLSGTSVMKLDDYCEILEKISSFSDDAVISFSLWGEPSSHPEITDFILKTLQYQKFSLLIETSGIGWEKGFAGKISRLISGSGLPGANERLIWIVSLDSDDPETYRKIRGEGREEAFAFAESLVSFFPETAYVQAVRMEENDRGLEKFYKSFKSSGRKIIVQKYDNFCGFLPDRKVTDISPLKRDECWHIKRDLPILLDGTVAMCWHDLEKKYILGNILKDPLEKIWKEGEKYYFEHLEGKYNELCRRCDEYYTYNF